MRDGQVRQHAADRQDGRVERGLAILEVQRDVFPIREEAPAAFQPLTN